MFCLAITGFDAQPDQITAILDLAPTSTSVKGQAGKSGRPRSFNGWWLEAYEPEMAEGSQHHTAVQFIVDQLKGRVAGFRTLRETLSPDSMTLYGGFHLRPDMQAGIWLEAEQMRVLAECGVGWGIDLFSELRSSDRLQP